MWNILMYLKLISACLHIILLKEKLKRLGGCMQRKLARHYLKQNFGIYSTINFTWNFPPFLPVFASNGNGIYTHTSSSTHMFMYCKNDSSFPDLMHCLESYPSLLTQYYYVWRKTFVKWKNFWEDSLCPSTLSFPNRETSAMYCTYYYYALYLGRMNKKQDR